MLLRQNSFQTNYVSSVNFGLILRQQFCTKDAMMHHESVKIDTNLWKFKSVENNKKRLYMVYGVGCVISKRQWSYQESTHSKTTGGGDWAEIVFYHHILSTPKSIL